MGQDVGQVRQQASSASLPAPARRGPQKPLDNADLCQQAVGWRQRRLAAAKAASTASAAAMRTVAWASTVLVLLFAQAELRVVDVVDRSAKTNIGVGECKDKFDQEKCVRAKEMGKCGWDIGRVECRETCGRCAEGRVIVDTEVLAKHKASKNPCGVGPEMEDSMKGVHRGMKDEPVAEHQI